MGGLGRTSMFVMMLVGTSCFFVGILWAQQETGCMAPLVTLHDLNQRIMHAESSLLRDLCRFAMQAVTGHVTLIQGRDMKNRQLLQSGNSLIRSAVVSSILID